jgi:hypothetical protein
MFSGIGLTFGGAVNIYLSISVIKLSLITSVFYLGVGLTFLSIGISLIRTSLALLKSPFMLTKMKVFIVIILIGLSITALGLLGGADLRGVVSDQDGVRFFEGIENEGY